MAVISENSGPRFRLVAIVGPTGSGKSLLAVAMARRFGGEIVSCDALQLYRGLEIGTGKLPLEQRSSVPHHLLDVIEPEREFSAAEYLALAVPTLRDIDRRGKLPLVVGGTGLYLRALLRGLLDAPGRHPDLRARLRRLAARREATVLHRLLARWDPRSAERLHPNDVVRVERALEITLLARRPMSELMQSRRSPLPEYETLLIGLSPPQEELARRIEARVSEMFERGWVEEVRVLLTAHGAQAPAFKAIGYRQILRHLAGELDRRQAQALTVRASLQYARRQRIWFRREPGIAWYAGGGDDPDVAAAVETRIADYLAPRRSAVRESRSALSQSSSEGQHGRCGGRRASKRAEERPHAETAP
jgi:tRNA dimethylallyltransferase